MSAVLRIVLLFFTALRLQRVLGLVGIGIVALIVTVAAFGRSPDAAMAVLGTAGLAVLGVFCFFPATVCAGVLLRALSAPRTSALLPHFRIKALSGALIFVASILLVVAACLEIGRIGAESPPTIYGVVFAAAFSSIFVLGVFLASASQAWLWVFIAGWFSFMGWLSADGPDRLGLEAATIAAGLLALTALAWGAFGLWYLRARELDHIDANRFWVFDTSRWSAGEPVATTRFSKPQAIRLWLFGTAPRDWRTRWRERPVDSLARTLLVVLVVAGLVAYVESRDWQVSHLLPGVAVLGSMICLFAAQHARRARYLWLRTGSSRRDLLGVVERRAMGQAAQVGGYLIGFAGLVWLFGGAPLAALLVALAPLLSGLGVAVYTGLASVRGPRWLIWIPALVMLFLSQITVLVPLAAGGSRTPYGLAAFVVGAHAGGAVLLRWIAVHNWRRIDWIELKPVRVGREPPRRERHFVRLAGRGERPADING